MSDLKGCERRARGDDEAVRAPWQAHRTWSPIWALPTTEPLGRGGGALIPRGGLACWRSRCCWSFSPTSSRFLPLPFLERVSAPALLVGGVDLLRLLCWGRLNGRSSEAHGRVCRLCAHLSLLLSQVGCPSSPQGLRTCTGWRRSSGVPATPSPSPSPATPTTASQTQCSRSRAAHGTLPEHTPQSLPFQPISIEQGALQIILDFDLLFQFRIISSVVSIIFRP